MQHQHPSITFTGKNDISTPSYTGDQQSSKNLGAAPKSQETKG